MLPMLIPTVIGAAGTYLANRQNVREAEKNRQFQKEMSDTAHQREVGDLIRAGLNPVLSAHGSGASTPGGAQARVEDVGEGASRGLASALAVRQAKAQIALTEAQAENVRGQTFDLQTQAASGRYDLIAQQVRSATLSADQAEKLLPIIIQQAKAELAVKLGSARAYKAAALLDELAATGAFNEAAFQKMVGTGGKWLTLIGEIQRTLKGRK